MSFKARVIMTTEGTYPYSTGGVSTWAHILVHEIKDIEFHILAIMMNPFVSAKFDLPSNVTKLINVPLWGTEEPTEYLLNLPFHKVFWKKINTKSDPVAISKFIEYLETITLAIYGKENNLDKVCETLYNFHNFFLKHDYSMAFKSEETWNYFYNLILDIHRYEKEVPSIYDVVEALRWLYRFFITLISPLPQADIYHSSAAALCGLPCILAKEKFGSKFLLTEHGIYVREQYLFVSREKYPVLSKRFIMGLIKLISRLNYYFADQISPVCAYNKRWEIKFGKVKEEKIKVIYNGIDVERFKKLDVPRINRPTVVTIARIDPLKDIETFIRACDLVRKKIPNVLCKVFGPPVDEKYFGRCQKLVRELNLEGNFIFAGKTSSPERAINEGDIFVLTSISEAFPFAVLEAMACEKAVVSSDVGGVREVLEGYGFLVKPRDYRAFAEKIVYLFENPSILAELSVASRQRVLNGFRIEDMTTNYKESYLSLIRKEDGVLS